MSERMYHYVVGQQTYGPFPESALQQWMAQGQMSRETLVWTEGMSNWVPASQLAPFAPPSAPARVPAPAQAPAHAQAPSPAQAAAEMAFTPSELLFFHAERFCKEGGILSGGNFPLLHSSAKVGYLDLSVQGVIVALLALEERGEVRLGLNQEKGLLRTSQVAVVEFVDEVQYWPPGSLEFHLIGMLTGQPPVKLRDLIYHFIGKNMVSPYPELVLRMQAGLAGRGFLILEEKKGLGAIFSMPKFHLAPHTMQAVAQHGAEGVARLLEGCRQGRSELYQAMYKGAESGIVSRIESD